MKWGEADPDIRHEFSISLDGPEVEYDKAVFRTHWGHNQVVVESYRFRLEFGPEDESPVPRDTLVTILLDQCPLKFDWGANEVRTVTMKPHMWRKTRPEDITPGTRVEAWDFRPGDFTFPEMCQIFRQVNEYMRDLIADIDTQFPPEGIETLDQRARYYQRYHAAQNNAANQYRYLEAFLRDYLQFLVYDELAFVEYPLPDDLASASLAELLEGLNAKVTRTERGEYYEAIITKLGLEKKLSRQKARQAREVLEQIEEERHVSDFVTVPFQDRDHLYRHIFRDKVIIPKTLEGAEIDLTEATEETLEFSPELYRETRHYASNVKTGKRVLVTREERDGETHYTYVKGDSRLKQEILKQPDLHLRRHGNVFTMKADTLHKMAYEAQEVKTLCFVNPARVLALMADRGAETRDLAHLPAEILQDYKIGHQLYHLAVQRLYSLEPQVLESLASSFGA